jgi:hypothetical protein
MCNEHHHISDIRQTPSLLIVILKEGERLEIWGLATRVLHVL